MGLCPYKLTVLNALQGVYKVRKGETESARKRERRFLLCPSVYDRADTNDPQCPFDSCSETQPYFILHCRHTTADSLNSKHVKYP
jgi:hypothetical protein